METVEVAPHALMRMALWPLETVEGFGSAELADLSDEWQRAADRREEALAELDGGLHDAIGSSSGPRRAVLLNLRRALRRRGRIPPVEEVPLEHRSIAARARDESARAAGCERLLEQAIERTLEADRRRLRDITAAAEFVTALSLANLELAHRWRRTVGRPLDDRSRTRRLEGTITRYVARAVGRATPNGAWAGTASCSQTAGRGVRLRPADGDWRVHPNLEPFERVVQHLRAHAAFLLTAPLMLDPLVQPHQLADRTEMVIAESLLRSGPSTRAELVERVAGSGIDPDEAAVAVDQLTATGRVVASFRLDVGLGDGWAVLEAAAGDLPHHLSEPWQAAVTRLRSIAPRLETALGAADIDAVGHAIEAGREILAAHHEATGVAASQLDPFIIDRVAPVAATWGPDVIASTTRLVDALLRFHDGLGVAEAYRQLATASITGRPSSPGSPHNELDELAEPDTLLGVFHRRFGRRGPTNRLEEAQATLHRAAAASIDGVSDVESLIHGSPRPGHMGALLVHPGGGRLLAGWGRPQPGLFWARLTAGDAELPSELPTGLRWSDQAGGGVEIVGRDPLNPNAALRAIEPHARLDGWDHASGFSLEVDSDGSIWIARDGALLRPTYDSTCAVGVNDPWSAVLFVAAMSHGWEFLSFGVPLLQDELDQGQGLPELRLGDAGSISARRWIVDEAEVAELLAAGEAEAMCLWLARAGVSGWPSLVRVRAGIDPTAPPLLMVTHSPLFLCSLLLSIEEPQRLVVTEVHPAEIAQVESGNRHIVELAVAWRVRSRGPDPHDR